MMIVFAKIRIGVAVAILTHEMDCFGYEKVRLVREEYSGLETIIAVHSTTLGPGAGGCRFWQYKSVEAALNDALRLSKGMSYKNAMADLPFGGGKAVIIRPPKFERATLFAAFGAAVDGLQGRYVTAEDVGTSVEDMKMVAKSTRYVSGISGGDPSPHTAMGVYLAMRAAVGFRLGRKSLKGLTVAVQGVGSVGRHLCDLIYRDGARLLVSDINGKELLFARNQFEAEVIAIDKIHAAQCDVFAPCALGGSLNNQTISELQAPIVCGAANNQLESDEDGRRLLEAGVTYVPDYVANAGGIINVAAEYYAWSSSVVTGKIQEISRRVSEILSER